MDLSIVICWLLWSASCLVCCHGNTDAKRLYDDLLKKSGYSKLVRPVANFSEAVQVKFGLNIAALNDVDEKNEIMTTTMWVTMKWTDCHLKWNLEEYGGVDRIYVPATSIWRPDVILSNSADGDYGVTIMTKATLTHTGEIEWEPPAVWKSICEINVEYFPFDFQKCPMKFLPWSHDGYKVDMQHIKRHIYARDPTNKSENPVIEKGIEMDDYVESQEWDILGVYAKRSAPTYPCCDEPYPDITFHFTLRRKTLFYSINVIIPCVCLTLLTLTAFYVPCDCSEKISISLTILLSLSMFQLLLFDILPGTSMKMPLLGKYILFTLLVIFSSIICTVITLNVKSRAEMVGDVPSWVKWIFLDIMARIMCMPQPTEEEQDQEIEDQIDWSLASSDMANFSNPYKQKFRQRKSIIQETMRAYRDHNGSYTPGMDVNGPDPFSSTAYCTACEDQRLQDMPPSTRRALEGVGFIAKHHQESDASRKRKDDWLYVAMVFDRFLLWIYVSLTLLCTASVLLNAPALYDSTEGLVKPTTPPPHA